MVLVKQRYVVDMAEKGLRIDNRKEDEYRKIEVETGTIKTAEGSARVRIGNTDVIVGVKLGVGVPYADRPNEGVLITSAELVPIADPEFEPGPPRAEAIELARVVDRGIRESGMIDTKKLSISEKEVWMVNVDIHVMDYDGNLIDTSSLAAVAALATTMMPKYENSKINVDEKVGPLPVTCKPVTVTVSKIDGKLFVDPCREEDDVASSRISFAIRDNGDICSVQKGGEAGLTIEEVQKAIDMAVIKSGEIRNLL